MHSFIHSSLLEEYLCLWEQDTIKSYPQGVYTVNKKLDCTLNTHKQSGNDKEKVADFIKFSSFMTWVIRRLLLSCIDPQRTFQQEIISTPQLPPPHHGKTKFVTLKTKCQVLWGLWSQSRVRLRQSTDEAQGPSHEDNLVVHFPSELPEHSQPSELFTENEL